MQGVQNILTNYHHFSTNIHLRLKYSSRKCLLLYIEFSLFRLLNKIVLFLYETLERYEDGLMYFCDIPFEKKVDIMFSEKLNWCWSISLTEYNAPLDYNVWSLLQKKLQVYRVITKNITITLIRDWYLIYKSLFYWTLQLWVKSTK